MSSLGGVGQKERPLDSNLVSASDKGALDRFSTVLLFSFSIWDEGVFPLLRLLRGWYSCSLMRSANFLRLRSVRRSVKRLVDALIVVIEVW